MAEVRWRSVYVTVRGYSVVDWSCTYFFQFQDTLRGSFHRSERPIWSRCPISRRSEVDELFLSRNGRCEVDVLSHAESRPIWSRWTISQSERPMWSRCPISCRVSADLKSMNYSPVWTADSKSMSYFLARMVDLDLMTPGYTDQWYWSMHRPVLFHCCIFVLVYWAVWWRNCAYKYVYVVGW